MSTKTKLVIGSVTALTAAAIGTTAVYMYDQNAAKRKLIIGGFNMQNGPYKISRIAADTTGLDSSKKAKILTFNKYCVSKSVEDAPFDINQALNKIFGIDEKMLQTSDEDISYEVQLIECLKWNETPENKWVVDVGATFAKYFDPVKHHTWTSAIVDMTPEVAKEMEEHQVDIMALVETSNGVKNANGHIIPHTDNLVKLLENLQNIKESDWRVAKYSQITNPAAETMPQLDRGCAIVYNANKISHLGTFVIEIESEKRKKVTVRRFPVCLFGLSGFITSTPTHMVCAAHISGYAYSDSQSKKANPAGILVGDKELESILKILSGQYDSSEKNVTIAINDKSYKLDDPQLEKLLKDMKVSTDLPTTVIGDFNQDFNKNSIQFAHEYRFDRFTPETQQPGDWSTQTNLLQQASSTSIASRFGFQNGYILAKTIHPTTNYGATIDGFLTKNVSDVTLVSKPYDTKTSTSDHSAVYAKL